MWTIRESKNWKHTSGRTASIYGAVPYYTDADKKHWTIETNGYSFYDDRTNTVHNFGKRWTRAEAVVKVGQLNNL
jgi:hypothetical protein